MVSDKNKVNGYVTTEILNIKSCPSFISYIRGGCQLNLVMAIDFTGSNKDPINP